MALFSDVESAFQQIERDLQRVLTVDLREQVVRMLDAEIARVDQEALAKSGIRPMHAFRKSPNGIKVVFDYSREIVADALKEIIRASPVGNTGYDSTRGYKAGNPKRHYIPGQYRKSWKVFVNGSEIETLDQVTWGAHVMLVNIQPYSRRLEVGRTRHGSFVIDVEQNFVELTALKRLRPKWKRLVDVSFNHVHLSDAYVLQRGLKGRYKDVNGHKRKRFTGGDHAAGSNIKYPAIIIEPKNV